MQISLDQTQIHMVNVQEEDEAVYTCVAKNRAGQDTHQFQLIVLGRHKEIRRDKVKLPFHI